jgi:hypothetical protein
VIPGHYGEEQNLHICKIKDQENMSYTASHRNGPVVCEIVDTGIGDSDRNVTHVEVGQILQEKLHGHVQVLVNGGEGDDNKIF